MKYFVATVVVVVVAEFQAPIDIEFLGGFHRGFFGKNSRLNRCLSDREAVFEDAGNLLADIKARNFTRLPLDLQSVFSDCETIPSDLRPMFDSYKDTHNVMKAKRFDELTQAVDACAFKEVDSCQCGQLIGEGSRQLILGDRAIRFFAEIDEASFFGGLSTSLFGHTAGYCAKYARDCVPAVKNLTFGLINGHGFIKMLKHVFVLMQTCVPASIDCKVAAKDLTPYLEIPDDVKTRSDMMAKVLANCLTNRRVVFGNFKCITQSCTFHNPDGALCGTCIGTLIRVALVGQAILPVAQV